MNKWLSKFWSNTDRLIFPNSVLRPQSLLSFCLFIAVLSVLLFGIAPRLSAHNGVVCIAKPLKDIQVDGDLSDWPDSLETYPIRFQDYGDPLSSSEDVKAWFRVAYSPDGQSILIAVEVVDDSVVVSRSNDSTAPNRPQGDWTREDGCSVYMQFPQFSRRIFQHDFCGLNLHSNARRSDDQRLVSEKIVAARSSKGNRICYEWKIERPDSDHPSRHQTSSQVQVAFDISINDRDQDGSFSWMSWGPGVAKVRNVHHLGDLLFVDTDRKLFRLQGNAKLDSGNVASHATFQLSDSAPENSVQVLVGTDANGQVDVLLPQGNYFVGQSNSNRASRIELAQSRNDFELTLNSIAGNHAPETLPAAVVRKVDLRGDRKRFFQMNLSRHMGEVTAVAQANDGGLWLASNKYLAYSDGQDLKLIKTDNADFRFRPTAMVEDKNGGLWIGSWTGLYRFADHSFAHFGAAHGMSQEKVLDLQIGSGGQLYVATLHGVCQFDGERFERKLEQRTKDAHITSLLMDDGNRFWIGTRQGLKLVDSSGITKFRNPHAAGSDFVTSLANSGDHKIWVGTSQGLYSFDGEKFTPHKGLGGTKIYSLASGPDGELFVGSRSGLFLLDGANFRPITRKQAKFLFVDREANLWSVLSGPSLVRFETRHLIRAFRNQTKGDVCCGMAASDGSIWLGTTRGLHRWTSEGERGLYARLAKFKTQQVTALLEDFKKNVWVASSAGVFCFDGENFEEIANLEMLDGRIPKAFVEDQQGRIWVGTDTNIFRIIDRNVSKFEQFQGMVSNQLMCLFEDSSQNIWIGTTFGICRFSPVDNLLEDQLPVPFGPVHCIFENGDGKFWIGTGEGVYVRENERWNKICAFGDAAVRSIKMGLDGQIWVSTESGLIIYDGFAHQVISERDGLQSNVIETTCKVDEETALVVTDQGMSYYRPNNSPPPVSIQSVRAGGLEVDQKDLELVEAASAYEFRFHGISFKTRPDAMMYSYRLIGLDNKWKLSNEPVAAFNKLLPGTYRFEVKAIDRDLGYSTDAAVIDFVVAKDPSKAWMDVVMGLTALAGFAAVVLIVRYYVGLKRFSGQLERRVEARTQEVEALNRKLLHAQKLEAIGTISSGVAHDINNSLAAIVNFAQLAEEKMDPGSEQAELIRLILDSTRQATGTTRSLLAFSGDAATEKRPRDIRKLLIRSTEFLDRLLPSSIQLSGDFEVQGKVICDVDEPAIQQVLMNLVINAKDAMPDGGVIHIRLEEHPPEEDFVAISVSDEGTGIDESLHLKIFDPFFSTKARGQGTGLGMSIAHGVILDHGGSIDVRSTPGNGATFRILLPRSKESAEELSENRSLNLSLDGKKFLIVEDNQKVQLALVHQLEALGCEVVALSDGHEAVSLFAQQADAFDLVLLDIDLPSKDGISCLLEIRELRQQVPVILMSGYPVKETEDWQATFLSKPFGRAELELAVVEAMPEASDCPPGVLVIDDDDLVRDSVAAYLDAHGLRTFQAVDDQSTHEILKLHSGKIGTVLMDWGLGETDSDQLLNDISHAHPEFRIVILSGNPANLSQLGKDGRITGYLQKPAVPSEILRFVS